MASASKTIGLAVVADQLTLHTKGGGLQRDEIDVLKSRAIYRLTKHECEILSSITVQMKVSGEAGETEVAVVVPGVENGIKTVGAFSVRYGTHLRYAYFPREIPPRENGSGHLDPRNSSRRERVENLTHFDS